MKRIFTALVFIIASTLTFSQTSIWKVSKGGNTVYLGGSIHLLRASDYPLPAEFDTIYKRASKLVFETDIAKLEDPATAQKMLSQGMYKDGKTLKNVLNTKVYQDLEKACNEVNLPIANLNQFKPSMVVLILTITKIKSLGVSEEGVDQYFFLKALADDKKTIGLEPFETQIKLLTTMGDGNENEFVKHSLNEFHKMGKQMTSLITSWKTGDTKTMIKELEEMKTEYPALYVSMLINRNNAWLPQIEGFLTDKEVEFIIVGSLHLHGNDGLLTLLRDKGYQVKQVQI